jgi:hypothetical protein
MMLPLHRPMLAALVVAMLACNTHEEPPLAPPPPSADYSDPAKAVELYKARREGTAVIIERPSSDEVRQSRGPPRVSPERPRVGSAKCKTCHAAEFLSWNASPHAAKGPDCEDCHGPGSEYWPASVMRDRSQAEFAGLVMATVAYCQACHQKADASWLPRAHGPKVRQPGATSN